MKVPFCHKKSCLHYLHFLFTSLWVTWNEISFQEWSEWNGAIKYVNKQQINREMKDRYRNKHDGGKNDSKEV